MKRARYLNPDAFCRFIGPKLVQLEVFRSMREMGPHVTFPPPHRIMGSPLGRLPSPTRYWYLQTSDDGGLTTDGSATELTSHKKRQRSRGSKGSRSGKSNGSTSDSNRSASCNGERKKKDGFSSKIHIPEFSGKKGYSSDVTEAF